MLELESLRLADAYDWLETGSAAAAYLHCSQSTVSRGMNKFKSLESELKEVGCIDLLEQERVIHQNWRFKKREGLRLHTYRWLNQLVHSALPDGWTTNPLEISSISNSVINLIVTRRIDAACLPYPSIAKADRTWLAFIPIFTSHLQLFTHAGGSLNHEKNLSAGDIGATTTLRSLSFVPQEARECSREIDGSLFGSAAGQDQSPREEGRYWGIPLTTLVAPNLQKIDFASPCPYTEFLVVRKEWADHPMIAQLLKSVLDRIGKAVHVNHSLQSMALAP